MKLSPYLAQFLYDNKELSLAGIGRFRMELPTGDDQSSDNDSKIESYTGISFEQDTTVKEDPALVLFISSQSGKMKSLAAADLDSYMELAKQFLNIGKPFLFDGIGTLTKNRSDKFDFLPVHLLHEKGKENVMAETDQTSTTEDSFKDYEEMLSPKKPLVSGSKKIVLWLAILAGMGLTVWGGYFVYTKTKRAKNPPVQKQIDNRYQDTANPSQKNKPLPDVKNNGSLQGVYRFIIEEANRSRALARYYDLKNWGINIQMETTDSVTFKLFFKLAVAPSDTSRIRDSLNLLYGTMGKTTIEQ